MNFEQLYKLIKKNNLQIKNKKKTKILLKYFYEISLLQKEKLKIETIKFIINEPNLNEYRFDFELEIKYSNNNVYLNKSKDFQNILQKFEWKWDIYNILSFFLVFNFLLFQLYVFCYQWYVINFQNFNNFDFFFIQINDFIIKNIFFNKSTIVFKNYLQINDFLINLIINFSNKFNYLL